MADEEYGKGVPMVISPQMGPIETVVEDIRYRAQLIARNQKLDSGVSATGVAGFIAGFIFAIVMVVIIPMFAWKVM
ncbi:tetrahydromethanopterin S-methyltransferase subunit F [Methanolobus sediminis]|uniref:Tetrahydromethanopterin S-methyltransferase subunit F n=1 Tax=Methanolobus sediminis TaxID=3072978 RepID=A0AA51UIL0_9EURY|nr:tetrahydromethanopterin S-methyltransferase subunit F [Methanolobus sediminis]WMW24201.1 tetrahydromethanopterin S-methyltransferase subunit F [Methanolobus sediminis]